MLCWSVVLNELLSAFRLYEPVPLPRLRDRNCGNGNFYLHSLSHSSIQGCNFSRDHCAAWTALVSVILKLASITPSAHQATFDAFRDLNVMPESLTALADLSLKAVVNPALTAGPSGHDIQVLNELAHQFPRIEPSSDASSSVNSHSAITMKRLPTTRFKRNGSTGYSSFHLLTSNKM
jgi:hypothetical protein